MLLRLATLALLLAPLAAGAAGFEAKTMRDPLPTREVERGLVLGKGWLEVGLGYDRKTATSYWNDAGHAVAFDSAEFLYTTERLDVRYGLTRRGEMYWRLPFHYVRLTNALNEEGTDQFGIGDPLFGYKWEVFRALAPMASAVVYGEYKAPLGNESPGNYIGGPNTFTRFIMSTGTPDAGLGTRVRTQVLGPIALTGGAAFIHRFSGIANYILETELNQFAGRIKPGDLTLLDADLMLQLGPLALHSGPAFALRGPTLIGTTAEGFLPDKNLETVADSDGWSLDFVHGVVLNATRGIDLDLAMRQPFRGEDLQFFPIEDIHPTRGTTWSGTLEMRY